MVEERHVGFELHRIDKLIGKSSDMITKAVLGEDMPPQGGWILGYLFRHEDRSVYQRDIERVFCMPPSTATKLLKQMEKKGYIRRVAVKDDARLKKIEILSKGENLHQDITDQIHKRVDRSLLKGLNTEEIDELYRMLDIIHSNVSALYSSWADYPERDRRDEAGDRHHSGQRTQHNEIV